MRGQFSRFLGPPGDPQICKKSGFSPQLGSHDSYFLDFCCERCYNQLFHQNLIDFRPKNHCVFHWFFEGFLVFLWTWRPSRNSVIYVSKDTFSCFVFSSFFGKTGRTSEPKLAPKKVTKNDLPGTLLGPKHGPKSDQEHPKVTTKSKNHRFLRG